MQKFRIHYTINFSTIRISYYIESDTLGQTTAHSIAKEVWEKKLNDSSRKKFHECCPERDDIIPVSHVGILKENGEHLPERDTEMILLEIANYLSAALSKLPAPV